MNLDKPSSFTATKEALHGYAHRFPKLVEAIGERVKKDLQEKEAIQSGDQANCPVNIGKFAHLRWGDLLTAKTDEVKNYVNNFLLNPANRFNPGSRLEAITKWLKTKKGIFASYIFTKKLSELGLYLQHHQQLPLSKVENAINPIFRMLSCYMLQIKLMLLAMVSQLLIDRK